MKAFLIRLSRPVVKAFYTTMKKTRRLFSKRQGMQVASKLSRQTSVVTPRTSPALVDKSQNIGSTSSLMSKLTNPKNWWKGWKKSWPLVAGSGAAVIIIVVVLVLTLSQPTSDNNSSGAYASLAEAVAVPASEVVDTADASPSAEVPTVLPTPTEDLMSTPVPTTAPEADIALQPGIHDSRVIELQSRLMELGYMDNDEPTDYYGGGTKFALELFQRKHSLQIDGLMGINTESLLYSDEALSYTVKMGDKGTDVKEIQERLKELNYFSGSATGEFGEKTESAVKSFQNRNGLSPDGNIGENTREVLFSEDAKEASSSSSGGSSGGGGSGGGGSSKTGPVATDDPDSGKADKLIEFAKTLLGKEYTRGGKGPNEFDCSGYVYYCLNHSGVKSIKYMTSGTWAKSKYPRIDKMSKLKKGDIICFRGHVAIYMGNGKMIHASSSADKVVINDGSIFSSSWCKRNFICGRRVL